MLVTTPVDLPDLEARRTALRISREVLGVAAGGISSSTIKRIERGEVKPNQTTVRALVSALAEIEATRPR
jgi:predicted transcriptional regulator